VGSSPGHPFIVRAAERTINLVLDRADAFDMERAVCARPEKGKEEDTQFWKLRAERCLNLSGPCALGISANEAVGRDPLEKFDLGWMPHPRGVQGNAAGRWEEGDLLLLKLDKNDFGAFRFSDTTRNVIVAATGLKAAIQQVAQVSVFRTGTVEKEHYSETAEGQWLWGSELVYHDLFVVNDTISFKVKKMLIPKSPQ